MKKINVRIQKEFVNQVYNSDKFKVTFPDGYVNFGSKTVTILDYEYNLMILDEWEYVFFPTNGEKKVLKAQDLVDKLVTELNGRSKVKGE